MSFVEITISKKKKGETILQNNIIKKKKIVSLWKLCVFEYWILSFVLRSISEIMISIQKKRLFSQISLWYHNFIFNLKIKLYYFFPPKKNLWLVTCITWNWHIIFFKKNRENYIGLVLMKNYCWTNTSDSWCRLIPLCYLEIIPKKKW